MDKTNIATYENRHVAFAAVTRNDVTYVMFDQTTINVAFFDIAKDFGYDVHTIVNSTFSHEIVCDAHDFKSLVAMSDDITITA